MGGIFGVASKDSCVTDLFFGTDYHSHLGTRRGGLATVNPDGFTRFIHDISYAPFRSKFHDDVPRLSGRTGIGVISDTDDQPVMIRSHLGMFAITTVGVIKNADALAQGILDKSSAHFSEMKGGTINPTEIVASLICEHDSFEAGIRAAQEAIEGSCTMVLLTADGLYAARDLLGRTPLAIGKKADGHAVSMETSAFPNLGYEIDRQLGPAEIVLVTSEGVERKAPPGDRMQICAFLWVYYGYPASSYEGINVEQCRNRCGAFLSRRDDVEVDVVAGVPDSGTGHAIGYANESKTLYARPFVKYTPTWPRSFMPPDQSMRDLVARMKLIPIRELISGQRMMFCEDSIVRGTQLKDTIQYLYDVGAKEVHMRPACPPLTYGCKFLNFSQSKSELDLAARRAIREIEGSHDKDLETYSNYTTDKYKAMVDRIGERLKLTTLRYQQLPDLVEAIGMPKDKLCTYCWDGAE